MKKYLLATAAALVLSSTAHANITPALDSVQTEGELYRYTYTVTLDTDQGLTPGSKVSIFDFAGFAGGLTSSDPDFVAATELFTPNMLTPGAFTDDSSILNLTLTWIGENYRAAGGPFPETTFMLSALSTFNRTAFDGYTANAVKNNAASEGQSTDNVGPVVVPFGTAVPEPAAWALMIAGFGGVGAMMRQRRQRLVTAS